MRCAPGWQSAVNRSGTSVVGHIFISHSSKDRAEAARVAALLDQGLVPYFLDYDPEDGIPAGRCWEDELYYRLAGCDAVLYLCSAHANASKWCFAELALARALRKPIVPLRLGAEPLPSLLADTQAIPFAADAATAATRLRGALALAASREPERFAWDGSRPLYPGIFAFDEADAAIFFGREAETQQMIDTLARMRFSDTRLLCVVGASGCGKSSVVRAGVVPRLRQRRADWLLCDPVVAGAALADTLAERLASCGTEARSRPAFSTAKRALAALTKSAAASSEAPLAALLRKLRGNGERSTQRCAVWVIDQGERLFAAEAAAALRLTIACAASRTLPLQIVLTLRSDHLDAWQACLAEAGVRYELMSIGPMAPARFAEVIEGPARLARLKTGAELVAAMASDASRRDGLPLLAFALHDLWQRGRVRGELSLSDYRDGLGGLEGCIARRAARVIGEARLDDAQRHLLRTTLTRMARLGDSGRFIAQPIAPASVPVPLQPVIARLVDERLLVSGAQGQTLEVAHEVLFRAWDELHAWLETERDFYGWQRDTGPALRAWIEQARDTNAVHLSGHALGTAAAWLATHREAMGAEAAAFVEASAARAVREETRAREAQVRQLAAQGQVILAFDVPEVGERGMLLAIEAMQRARSLPAAQLEPDQAIRLGLSQLGRPVAKTVAPGVVSPRAWAVHPAKPLVVYGAADGRLRLWNLGGSQVQEMPPLAAAIDIVEISAGGRWIAAAAGAQVLLFDSNTNKANMIAPPDSAPGASAVAFSPSGDHLAVAFHDRTMVWATGALETAPTVLPLDSLAVVSLSFSGDGTVLIEQRLSQPASCWRWRDATRVGHIGSGGNQVLHSADGRFVGATGPGSFVAHVWDTFERHNHQIANNGARLAFSADSRWLAMASPEHFVRLWQLPDLHEARTLRHHAEVWDLEFSPDGKMLATLPRNGVVEVWDTHSGAEVARLIHHEAVRALHFVGDSRHLVTLSGDGCLTVWNTRWLREAWVGEFTVAALGVAFSEDGALLAVSLREGWGKLQPLLIDLRNYQAVEKFEVPNRASVSGADYARELLRQHDELTKGEGRSASGRLQAARSENNHVVTVGEAAAQRDGPRTLCVLRHDHPVHRCIFSPDERHLATLGERDTVRVWSLEHGVEVSRLTHEQPALADAAFSPDGRCIATAGWDCTVRLWWWQPDDLVAQARTRVQIALSAQQWQHYLPNEPVPVSAASA